MTSPKPSQFHPENRISGLLRSPKAISRRKQEGTRPIRQNQWRPSPNGNIIQIINIMIVGLVIFRSVCDFSMGSPVVLTPVNKYCCCCR